MGTTPPRQRSMVRYPGAVGAARAPRSLGDFRSACALSSRGAAAAFAAETHEAQGLIEVCKAAGHGKAGVAEGPLPACTPAHPGTLGALENTPETLLLPSCPHTAGSGQTPG